VRTHPTGPTPLSRLIAIGVEEFAAEYWGRQALLSRAESLPGDDGFGDLLDPDGIDELVSARGLRTPFLRVAKAGRTLADRDFTAPGGVGAGIADQVSDDRLTRLFADGSTLVLQALHRTWSPVLAFCQDLAAQLGHPVQANAYITPPQNQGFSDHYDVHDVFVLQIEGEKRWSIHPPVIDSPLRDQPWTDRRAAVESRATEPAVIEEVLRPGDCLYLPRGFLHAAEALGGISTHLTIGVHVWTRYALAERLVAEAVRALAGDASARVSLPLGVEFVDGAIDDDVEAVRGALLAAVEAVDRPTVVAALRQAGRRTARAAPIGPLAQFRTAERLQPGSSVSLRQHLAGTVERRADGRAVLRSRADDLVLEAEDVPAVKALLARGTMSAGELGVDLARRLVLAGAAVCDTARE
jgi:bifunctional lysine-specific demethylase and histidyl-hydroxylase NO66